MPEAPRANATRIHSHLAHDPDMAELIDLFVSELPGRVESLAQAWRARDLKAVQRTAHQLKGSCAGYGFPALGNAAARVEDSIRTKSPEQVQLDELSAGVKELIDLCHRASPGPAVSKAA